MGSEMCIRDRLTRRTSALELVKWTDHHEKGRAAEVLVMDAMSSEDSCYEDDENGNPKVTKYAVRKLPWESRAIKKSWIKHTGRGCPREQMKEL